MTAPAIYFEKVNKTYSSDIGHKSVALQQASFAVEFGEIFGIIGPNGAGKSTALKILLGLIHYDSGTIQLRGNHPSETDSHQHIGYLPENPCLYNNLTIIDHLQFAGKLAGYSSKQVKNRTEELLELVELSHVAKKAIRSFSKGMTQRAALAYALFHQPEILILDEPMSGLDPLGRKLVIDIINDYNKQGNTVLFCSHILNDVERICDRIGIMNRGKITATLITKELSDEISLETIFLDTVAPA